MKWRWLLAPPPDLGEVGGEVSMGGRMKAGIVGSEPKCWLGRGMGVEERGSCTPAFTAVGGGSSGSPREL